MSRFDKIRVTFNDGTTETIRGYSLLQDGVLHVLDHDGRDPTQSFPLINVRKYEGVRG